MKIESDKASIGNEYLLWEMSLAGGRLRTAAITNRRTGKVTKLEGEDFVIELENGKWIRASECQVKQVSEVGRGQENSLVVYLEHPGLPRGHNGLSLVTAVHAGRPWVVRELTHETIGQTLAAIRFGEWKCENIRGQSGPGKIETALGFAGGCGQPVYVDDLFMAIRHPGAEHYATSRGLSCRLPVNDDMCRPRSTRPPQEFIVGAGEDNAARRAFLEYIDATRPVPARMIFLVNDWYWKDKTRPLEAMQAFAQIKKETGVPIDSFTLDDGWDMDAPIGSGTKPDAIETRWEAATGLWGRLSPKRFPGGWEPLTEALRPADIGLSLWFGPIGGYSVRKKRVAFGQTAGYEINGDKLCLAGPRYQQHVIASFSQWAAKGMDYIKVDGFWPNCQQPDHGHPVGPVGAIYQMNELMKVFAEWRKANPRLVIGYTSGSNPSPFWLQHCDFVWRGGADDQHAGVGDPFDRHNTYLDSCLQAHRQTEMPISAFVTFDIVQRRTQGNSREAFERGVWWLAARTSLHHDWYVEPNDLTTEEWKVLAKAAQWARQHEKVFRFSRMIGGDPRKGEVYGFAAFDGRTGTLAFRHPGDKKAALRDTLANLLDLSKSGQQGRSIRLRSVFGATKPLEGDWPVAERMNVVLAPFAIAVLEVETQGGADLTKAPRAKRVSLDAKDEPLADVVRSIAAQAGVNIVYDARDLRGRVTIVLRDVPPDEALRSVLRTHGMDVVREPDGVHRLVPRYRR
ncbi:MAG: hypothetical protein N3D11_05925 [Candidatus Sumerlaeia bacterium]|nr:hypothetical protein [Candidatus Sumerlaeia bacterium]